MATAPKCRLCGGKHWGIDGHDYSLSEALSKMDLGETVTKSKGLENVTLAENVTVQDTIEIEGEPLLVTLGGRRPGAGRKAKHGSAAERQRAYRQRTKQS